MHGTLGRSGSYCAIMTWERHTHSQLFHLQRACPPRGWAGFVNGLGSPLELARHDAFRHSDALLDGHELHCVYNASAGHVWDTCITPALQGGTCLPPVRLLLQLWMHFLWRHRGSPATFLQLCQSQGAVHVRNALAALPPAHRRRIRVLALCPAAFIPPSLGVEVVHVYKLEDPVLLAAHGYHSMPRQDRSMVCVPHDDGCNSSHNPHGGSYVRGAKPYAQRWLQTGSLFAA